MTTALYYFVVAKGGSVFSAFLLGLCIYGVFETTNLAIFAEWDVNTALIDIGWGGVLFALTYKAWQVTRSSDIATH